MRNLSRVILVLVLLLLVTSVATAKGPDLEPFSTTGYTTNFIGLEPLGSSGFSKFYVFAQGGAAVDDDDMCGIIYEGKSCAEVCDELDNDTDNPQPDYPLCGTDGFFSDGSFVFEEWGIYYPPPEDPPTVPPVFNPYGISLGVNHGLLNVLTDGGEANLRFGGLAAITFEDLSLASQPYSSVGSFTVLDGEGDYKGLKGEGTYDGDAALAFTVDYVPCEGNDCPDRCAVFGTDYKIKKNKVVIKDIKLKKDKLEWGIKNEGEDDLIVSSIRLWWSAGDILDKVKYGGKTVFEGSDNSGYYPIDLTDWTGKPKDLELKANKKKKLKFEFDNKDISQEPSDYTILVEFSNGCAVTYVAF